MDAQQSLVDRKILLPSYWTERFDKEIDVSLYRGALADLVRYLISANIDVCLITMIALAMNETKFRPGFSESEVIGIVDQQAKEFLDTVEKERNVNKKKSSLKIVLS